MTRLLYTLIALRYWRQVREGWRKGRAIHRLRAVFSWVPYYRLGPQHPAYVRGGRPALYPHPITYGWYGWSDHGGRL